MATPTRNQALLSAARFVASASVSHAVTYFVAGIIAAQALGYAALFEQPILRDYYLPSGSVDIVASGLAQLVRGAMFGLVLLPFRGALAATRLGWLWLWLLFCAIGVLGTPAASPGSFEGVLYSRLPLWFHLVALPEVMLQTLAFSVLVHRSLRAADHPLRPALRIALNALAVACISFFGYTAVSLAFAFAAGVGTESGADLRVLGQFLAPLLLTFAAVLVADDRLWLPKHAALYVASAGALALYQWLVLGSTGWAYVLLAPILPVLISLAMTRPRTPKGGPVTPRQG